MSVSDLAEIFCGFAVFDEVFRGFRFLMGPYAPLLQRAILFGRFRLSSKTEIKRLHQKRRLQLSEFYLVSSYVLPAMCYRDICL